MIEIKNTSGIVVKTINTDSLREADLSGADLIRANLSWADLSRANLSRANLSWANLSWANLSLANLSEANLSLANLSWANLSEANLSEANLSRANLSEANLSEANLSRAKNLPTAQAFLSAFDADELGVIVYKAVGRTTYSTPSAWVIKPGSFLTEVCNPNPTDECGCGVNFGTLKFCKNNYPNSITWKCRIRWIDLCGVVVPYASNGKARCNRLELLEVVNK